MGSRPSDESTALYNMGTVLGRTQQISRANHAIQWQPGLGLVEFWVVEHHDYYVGWLVSVQTINSCSTLYDVAWLVLLTCNGVHESLW